VPAAPAIFPDLSSAPLRVFICRACSLASEEVSLALLTDLTLSEFPSAGIGKRAGFSHPPRLGKSRHRRFPTFQHPPLLARALGTRRDDAPASRRSLLSIKKSHSQLYVPVFPVDRVPNHHQEQRQHPEDLPSCAPGERGGKKDTVKPVPGARVIGGRGAAGPWGHPGGPRMAEMSLATRRGPGWRGAAPR